LSPADRCVVQENAGVTTIALAIVHAEIEFSARSKQQPAPMPVLRDVSDLNSRRNRAPSWYVAIFKQDLAAS